MKKIDATLREKIICFICCVVATLVLIGLAITLSFASPKEFHTSFEININNVEEIIIKDNEENKIILEDDYSKFVNSVSKLLIKQNMIEQKDEETIYSIDIKTSDKTYFITGNYVVVDGTKTNVSFVNNGLQTLIDNYL